MKKNTKLCPLRHLIATETQLFTRRIVLSTTISLRDCLRPMTHKVILLTIKNNLIESKMKMVLLSVRLKNILILINM